MSDLGLNVTPEEYVRKVLAVDLPAKERSALRDELIWNFVLEKNAEKKRAKKKPRKNTFLTRKERVTKALLKLPKDGWDYQSLQPIRDMWKQYMRENIDFNPDVPKFTDTEWMNLNVVTGKCEYVGAEVEVIRSRSPCIVGVKGTLVLETKMTFQVVTPASKLKSMYYTGCPTKCVLTWMTFLIRHFSIKLNG